VHTRLFVLRDRFIDVRRNDGVGDNARLCKQRLATRTLARQNEEKPGVI
jgi:hypothetical protein